MFLREKFSGFKKAIAILIQLNFAEAISFAKLS
jgi:hypothetical protein